MIAYRLLLLLKLTGVLLFAGGLIGNFVATSLADRKRAVHGVGSKGLMIAWVAGYLLTFQTNVAMSELWIIGGIGLSLASQLAAVHSVARDRRTVTTYLLTFVPLLLVLVLMIFRPTWSLLRT